MSRIEGKRVLITGGATGIGRLMGEEVLRKGAKELVVWDINAEQLRESTQHFLSLGFQIRSYVVDVADTQAMLRTYQVLLREAGPIDILINNAAIVVGKNFCDYTHEDIDRTLQVNSASLMHIAKAVLPEMRARGSGHIVNIASAAGMLSNPGMSVYCASKWAVIGWSDSLRLELKDFDPQVKVTTVTPYYIHTGMFDGVKSPVIPILRPEPTARKIIQSIEKDLPFLRMPRLIYFLPLVSGLLPTQLFDLIVGKWLGIYRTMSGFKGRK